MCREGLMAHGAWPGLADTALRRCTLCPADPMNALQSLTGGPAAGAAGIGLPARGPGQPLGGMGGLGAMGQPMPLSGQPPPGTSGMAPHGMAVVSTAAPQSEYTTLLREPAALSTGGTFSSQPGVGVVRGREELGKL